MNISLLRKLFVASSGLLLAGCATQAEIAAFSDPVRGFAEVQEQTQATVTKDTVWIQSHQQAEAIESRVQKIMRKQTIDADTAVQVALLSNKGL